MVKQQFNIDDLNEQLYAQLQLLNTDLQGDNLKNELQKSKAMTDIASTILDGKRIQLDAIKLISEGEIYKESLSGIINPKKTIGQ